MSCWKDYPFQSISNNIICTRGENNKNISKGFSGGPLVHTESGALVGLSIFGPPEKEDSDRARAFTDISAHLGWIETTTGISGCTDIIKQQQKKPENNIIQKPENNNPRSETRGKKRAGKMR